MGADCRARVSHCTVTRELCESELYQLHRQAERVLQLAHRLSAEQPSDPAAAAELPLLLRHGAASCLAALQPLAGPPGKTGPAGLPELPPAAAGAHNPAMVQMMQQYSDALLTMMQQRMQPPG